MPGEFCDTNVLVYAYDRSDTRKQRQAADLLDRLWTDHAGIVSVQVLQELFVTLRRKLPAEDARAIVLDLSEAWPVIEPSGHDVVAAIDRGEEWQLSFWDAMMLTAANKAGAEVVWTEDLQHGQRYGDVRALNPFSSRLA